MNPLRSAVAFEALEARQLLAQSGTFTDADGDEFTIKLTGPGAFAATLSGGGTGLLQQLDVTATDATSALTITVKRQGGGNGRLAAKTLNVGRLKSLTAPGVDFSVLGGEIAAGLINTLTIGSVLGQSGTTFPIGMDTATDTDRVKFTFANGVRMNLNIRARLTEIRGNQNLFGTWNLDRGADRITIANDLAVELSVDFNPAYPLAIGTMKTGFLTLNSAINGSVGVIDAANIGDGSLGVEGSLGLLRSRGDQMSLDVFAGSIRTFDAKSATLTGVTFGLSAPDADGFSLRTFSAGALDDFTILTPPGGTTGLIGSMAFAEAGTVRVLATALGSFTSRGVVSNLELTLGGATQGGLTLRSLRTGGSLTGLIDCVGPIGSVRALGTGPGPLDTLELRGHSSAEATVGSVRFDGTEQSRLKFDVATLGSLRSKGRLIGSVDLRGADAAGLGLSLLEAPGLALNINAAAGAATQLGGIRTIRTQVIGNCTIAAGYISSLTVIDGAEGDGQIADATIRVNGADADGFGLRSATLAGGLIGAGLQAKQNIGRVSVRFLSDAVIQAGQFAVQPFLINSLIGQTPGARIDQLTVTGAFSASPVWQNSFVNAPEIGKVAVKGLIDITNGGDLHGLAATLFGTVSIRSQTNQALPVSLVGGNNEPFGAQTDFIIRVLV